ncbi:HEAT repeat domain-containing protein [Salarchaeum japonicum]|uniref:HEAT repeat domain-containing protein n=1 Tax=Salarchaeum japonicum TaxID=555573 RepID=A0AAV3SY33_9EURY|nr:HEAT repeat domain-containing protein [Salarchaeum japonicum]
MDDPPATDRLRALLRDGEYDAASDGLARVMDADAAVRRRALNALRDLADDRPGAVAGVAAAVVPFLTDDERSFRLGAAKLFAALADADPDAVRPVADALADRLRDDDEFYFVRARCAEALGYVALDHPDVASPAVLADLRVGLEFDEPEVRERLAQALECVALGDPNRLRNHAGALAGHLDDGSERVRYHLASALVAVATEHPERLADAADALADRLSDDRVHVRGRAAEALGLLARADTDAALPVDGLADAMDDEAFVAERARFALPAAEDGDAPADVGTLAGVRRTTRAAVAEMTAPDGECQHCGLALPASGGPPTCPRCGAPR